MGKKLLVVVVGIMLIISVVSCAVPSKIGMLANIWKSDEFKVTKVHPVSGTDDLLVTCQKLQPQRGSFVTMRIGKSSNILWQFEGKYTPKLVDDKFIDFDNRNWKIKIFGISNGKQISEIDARYACFVVNDIPNLCWIKGKPDTIGLIGDDGKIAWESKIDCTDIIDAAHIDQKLIIIGYQTIENDKSKQTSGKQVATSEEITKAYMKMKNEPKLDSTLKIIHLDYATGKETTKLEVPYDGRGVFQNCDSPGIFNIVINNAMMAIDCTKPGIIWESKDNFNSSSLISEDGKYRTIGAVNDREIGLVDPSNGQKLWTHPITEGFPAYVKTYGNVTVVELRIWEDRNPKFFKMMGFDNKTGKVLWERNLEWYAVGLRNDESYFVGDEKENKSECITVNQFDSDQIEFLDLQTGKSIAKFANPRDSEILALEVYGNNARIIYDDAVLGGKINTLSGSIDLTDKLEFPGAKIQANEDLYGIVNLHKLYPSEDFAVFSNNSSSYICDLKNMAQIMTLEGKSFNHFLYQDNSIYGWQNGLAVKIDLIQ